ncbi:MAG: acyl carrier protein [Tissierellia bacterium]|nr:acyl carrier protein [Tissierellia bacterium]
MLELVKKIIAEQMGVDQDSITPKTNLVEDLKADSIDAAEMILSIEDQLDILVDDDAIMNVKTVQDILDILK